MFHWLTSKPYRYFMLLAVYFAVHVVIRVMLSDSLDLDESEQTFLSQWLQPGYNSQPPFYNWGQGLLIQWFGPSVLVLAVFKNILLLLTYVVYFYAARLVTRDNALAVVASLGLLTIPQIAWESQRDLAHTVAATLAAATMIYAIFRAVKSGHAADYAFTGVAIGIALISKYNTALIVAGVLVALVSMKEYRSRVLSPKILYTIIPAVLIVAPHFLWVLNNLDLASGNTIAKLSANADTTWGQNVVSGVKSLASAVLNFSAVSMIVFLVVFGRTFLRATWAESPEIRLLNRSFGAVLVILSVLVLTGKATAFKDRWLQPVLFLLPLYFVLKMKAISTIQQRLNARFAVVGVTLMLAVMMGIIYRTAGASMAGKYRRLNVPYASIGDGLVDEAGESPGLFVTNDVWIAGNLKMQFPDTPVISTNASQMKISETDRRVPVVLVSQKDDSESLSDLAESAASMINAEVPANQDWNTVTRPYLYSDGRETVSMKYTILR